MFWGSPIPRGREGGGGGGGAVDRVGGTPVLQDVALFQTEIRHKF